MTEDVINSYRNLCGRDLPKPAREPIVLPRIPATITTEQAGNYERSAEKMKFSAEAWALRYWAQRFRENQ